MRSFWIAFETVKVHGIMSKRKKGRKLSSHEWRKKRSIIRSSKQIKSMDVDTLTGTLVYTDGVCTQSGGMYDLEDWCGGYGFCIPDQDVYYESVCYHNTTINRMGIKSIVKALESISVGGKYVIMSDNQYCTRSINEWLPKWIRKKELEAKKNSILWKRFLKIKQKHIDGGSDLSFHWIRGSSSVVGNREADALAMSGMMSEIRDVCTDDN